MYFYVFANLSMGFRKIKGKRGEQIALTYLQSIGLHIVDKNYTIPGGEIDLIVESPDIRVFVEVKYVKADSEIAGYISPKQLQIIYRSVQRYQLAHPSNKLYRVDAIFVSDNKVIEHYENISLYE